MIALLFMVCAGGMLRCILNQCRLREMDDLGDRSGTLAWAVRGLDATAITNIAVFTPAMMRKADAYAGSGRRLRQAMRRAIASTADNPFQIIVLGGSVTAGSCNCKESWRAHTGCAQRCPRGKNETWPFVLRRWLRGALPAGAEIKLAVAARGGRGSAGGQHFIQAWRGRADLVLVEAGINDMPCHYCPDMHRTLWYLRVRFEALLRTILRHQPAGQRAAHAAPPPAVLVVEALGGTKWRKPLEMMHMGEEVHGPVAKYYDVPILSLRDALLPALVGDGSERSGLWGDNSTGNVFYMRRFLSDSMHPGRFGQRVMAQFVARKLAVVAAHAAITAAPLAGATTAMPPPIFLQPADDALVPFWSVDLMTPTPRQTFRQNATRFEELPVVAASGGGCRYRADAPGKYGVICDAPGAEVAFRVRPGPAGRIVLGFQKGYDGMGAASVALAPDAEHDHGQRAAGAERTAAAAGGWQKCAGQNGICRCVGRVRFGNPKNPKYLFVNVTAGATDGGRLPSVACNKKTFGGNPAKHVAKSCECLPAAGPAAIVDGAWAQRITVEHEEEIYNPWAHAVPPPLTLLLRAKMVQQDGTQKEHKKARFKFLSITTY